MLGHRLSFAIAAVITLGACQCTKDRLTQVPPPQVDAGQPCVASSETCNGRDDDCDGATDEELGTIICGADACAATLPACTNGEATPCSPRQPTAETCNGQDDDCDGATDEELLPMTCGMGECALVQASCSGGQPTTCTPRESQLEQCNGLDDDCDGTVDEGLLLNTSGDVRVTEDPASSDFVYMGKGGEGFGLVWQDKRDETKGQIYFAQLSLTGVRTSATDTRVTSTSGSSVHPAVAWTGNSWGLVYADDGVDNRELYYRPLNASGQPTAAPTRLTNATGASDWPDVVWTGQTFAVAYDDARAGSTAHDIYFLRFDKAGVKLGGEIRVTTHSAKQSNPILKWTGSEFGLAWIDSRHGATNTEIYFQRLSPTGQLLGNEVRVTQAAGLSSWPDLAWNDVERQWAVVWHDTRDDDEEVYFARLDAMGQKLGADTRLTNSEGFSGFPSIDWNGFQYGVSWQDERNGKAAIYFAPVSARGVKNGSEVKLSTGSGSSSFTTAAWNGNTFAFSWRDDRDGSNNTELYFAYVGCPQ